MRYLLIVCTLSLLIACVKDKPNPHVTTIPFDLFSELIILNEGSCGNNNSELSVISNQNKQLSQYRFKNGKSLGDVAQDIAYVNGKYFITLNGSNKIEVCNPDFLSHMTINNVAYPRYLLPINAQTAYVSSLYNPFVYVLDLNNMKVKDTIRTSYDNTENMLVQETTAYITCWNTQCNYLYKVNTQTHQLYDSIDLQAYAPHQICEDKNGMLWVLCGNKDKGVISSLVQVNPSTKSITKKIDFVAAQDPFRMKVNTHGDSLYFIMINYNGQDEHNGLYKMGIFENSIPLRPFIQAPTLSYFWGFEIEPISKRIFITDPKGFTQSSTILTYSENGTLIGSFQAGIGSSKILFR